MINLVILGAKGRMGLSVLDLAKKDKDIKIITQIDKDNKKDLSCVLKRGNVVIDFSTSVATIENLEKVVAAKIPIVIGTTGFDKTDISVIKKASHKIPILLSPNMSLGVNVFFDLIKKATEYLSSYDLEVLEIHHNKKKDAPSGTAFKTLEILRKASGKNNFILSREGISTQKAKDEIGVSSIRLGNTVGEHTVFFEGEDDRIEITHKAMSRDAFARGAIASAKWIINKENGLFDSMDYLKDPLGG